MSYVIFLLIKFFYFKLRNILLLPLTIFTDLGKKEHYCKLIVKCCLLTSFDIHLTPTSKPVYFFDMDYDPTSASLTATNSANFNL